MDSSPPFSRSTTCFPLSVPLVVPPGRHRNRRRAHTHTTKNALTYSITYLNSTLHTPIPICPFFMFITFLYLYSITRRKFTLTRNILSEHPPISFDSSAHCVSSFCAVQRSKGMVRQRVSHPFRLHRKGWRPAGHIALSAYSL